jgi:hypothetical protein
MSKILKRPMFRKGGQVEEGVMSLAAPRNNYADGGLSMQELMEKYPEMAPDYQKYLDFYTAASGRDYAREKEDVLANLLIRGGLGLVSGEGAGKSTLGAVATAFKGPTERAMGEYAAIKKAPGAMRTAALGSALEAAEAQRKRQAEAEEARIGREFEASESKLQREATAEENRKKREADLAKARIGKGYEAQTAESQVKSILSLYEDVPGMDVGAATTLSRKDVRAATLIPTEYGGMIPMNPQDRTQIDIAWVKTQPDNTVLLNPYDRLYYKKRGNQLILLDQKTLEEPKGE